VIKNWRQPTQKTTVINSKKRDPPLVAGRCVQTLAAEPIEGRVRETDKLEQVDMVGGGGQTAIREKREYQKRGGEKRGKRERIILVSPHVTKGGKKNRKKLCGAERRKERTVGILVRVLQKEGEGHMWHTDKGMWRENKGNWLIPFCRENCGRRVNKAGSAP